MAWLLTDRRGPEWKQGWTTQTLSSISLPPPPLLAFFSIVLLFLSLSKYMDYRAEMEKTETHFQVYLFLLPILILIVRLMDTEEASFTFWLPRLEHQVSDQVRGFPWGVMALVVMLLVLISYHSSFRSHWFRPLWKSC